MILGRMRNIAAVINDGAIIVVQILERESVYIYIA